jgi:glycosyltransferase involved in cell wall biosynthesis
MRVFFSSEIWATQRRGGISRVFLALADELHRSQDVRVRLVAPVHRNDPLARSPLRRGLHVPRTLDGRGAGRAARRLGRMADARAWRAAIDGGAIWHATYLDVPERCDAGVPVVVSVWDLIHDEMPMHFPDAAEVIRRKRRAYERADRLVAISADVRTRLLDRYDIDPGRVDVVRLGVDPAVFRPVAGVALRTPYVLHVGDRHGYKDFSTALAAIRQLREAKLDVHLVAFGGGPPTPSERQTVASLGLSNHVRFTTGEDDSLARHYSSALALVVPSRCEGFGLPVVEAMACGCPVVAAAAGAVPEVSAGAAELVPPGDVEAFAAALTNVITDDAVADRRRRAGRARAAELTWSATAAGMVDAYRAARGESSVRVGGT